MAKQHDEAPLWVSVDDKTDDVLIRRAIVREKISTLTETKVEFLTQKNDLKLEELLGKKLTLHLKTEEENERLFSGTIVTIESKGWRDGYNQLIAEVRPWFWMLTQTLESRIFQNKTTREIIEQIFSDRGFSSFEFFLSESLVSREYCVQYRESDFDFISRLMEEEGMYYFFDHAQGSDDGVTLVIGDGKGAHSKAPENDELEYVADARSRGAPGEFVSEFLVGENVVPGKVSLRDFDFLTPATDLTVLRNANISPKHKYKSYELYDYPRHYRKDRTLGEKRADVILQSEEVRYKRATGKANAMTLATGCTFKLKAQEFVDGIFSAKDINDNKTDLLVTDAVYYLQSTSGFEFTTEQVSGDTEVLEFPEGLDDIYQIQFGTIPLTVQYRAPLSTPWPEIPGMHTAIVVGPSGEEIHTDKHGRIKVQFHWDREGKKDDKSSCWVRVMTPWSGKNWGMVAVPRIGQEVVIQFEEGDPDRPICTGMLYNADTMPPYKYPDDATQSGIKTNSSKGGGGFNELMFEDKKGAELVRFQAQRDYQQIVKNDAEITIGTETKEEGNLTVTVHNDVTETIKEGSHTYTVEMGNVIETIEEGNHTFDVSTGTQEITIEGDKTETIKTGDRITSVDSGNHETTVKAGNHTTEVKTGNHETKVKLGKITMEAMQKIELKVGASTLTLEPAKITLKSPIVNIQGDAMVEVKSVMTNVKGDAMLVLKGGLTMVN